MSQGVESPLQTEVLCCDGHYCHPTLSVTLVSSVWDSFYTHLVYSKKHSFHITSGFIPASSKDNLTMIIMEMCSVRVGCSEITISQNCPEKQVFIKEILPQGQQN